jgi:hypothetical protein
MKIQKPIIAPPVSSKKIWDTISLEKGVEGGFKIRKIPLNPPLSKGEVTKESISRIDILELKACPFKKLGLDSGWSLPRWKSGPERRI